MGFGMGLSERHIYDPQNGLPGNVGLIQAKPPSYLDVPSRMQTLAVDIEDPQNPVGAKGIGEPVQGCATAAVMAAIADALGGRYLNRVPVVADMIVNAAAGRAQSASMSLRPDALPIGLTFSRHSLKPLSSGGLCDAVTMTPPSSSRLPTT